MCATRSGYTRTRTMNGAMHRVRARPYVCVLLPVGYTLSIPRSLLEIIFSLNCTNVCIHKTGDFFTEIMRGFEYPIVIYYNKGRNLYRYFINDLNNDEGKREGERKLGLNST